MQQPARRQQQQPQPLVMNVAAHVLIQPSTRAATRPTPPLPPWPGWPSIAASRTCCSTYPRLTGR